jgi:type IV secretion system protein VirB1
MLVTAPVLATLLQTCAPMIGPRTMTAIVHVESSSNPLAIHDNTVNRSWAPQSVHQAIDWATYLIREHHSVDLGLSQINSANLPKLGLSVADVFDPCTNLRAGAQILSTDYRQAIEHFGPGQYALRRAIGAYNSGNLYAGYAYVTQILAAAGIAAEQDFAVPNLAPMNGETTVLSPATAPVLLRVNRSLPARTSGVAPSSSPVVVFSRPQTPVPASASPPPPASPAQSPVLVTVPSR